MAKWVVKLWIRFCLVILIAVVMQSRQTGLKPIIAQIKPIRMNMIVIRARVDITISVCQMINYRGTLIVLLTWKQV